MGQREIIEGLGYSEEDSLRLSNAYLCRANINLIRVGDDESIDARDLGIKPFVAGDMGAPSHNWDQIGAELGCSGTEAESRAIRIMELILGL